MDKKITDLYDDYKKRGLNRLDFLKKLATLAGGSAAAAALLPVLEGSDLAVDTFPQTDPELVTEFIKYPGINCEMRAYLARPAANKKYPAVIVIIFRMLHAGWQKKVSFLLLLMRCRP
jgi:carboxymethylenebutenolidase